jgi:Putative Flp pilus-assembly TadE/G-like
MCNPSTKTRRRGAVTPLIALLLVFLLGMVGFSVDLGYVALAQTELQSAADCAALAGCGPLMQGFVQYNLPGQSTYNQAAILSSTLRSARTSAKTYAAYNAAGGASSLALNDSDIEFGFTDASNNYTPMPTYTGFPNTCKVTMRRDSTANGAVSLFFAPVLGITSQNLKASAAATLFAGSLNSFSAPPRSHILPATYDINAWNTFLQTGQDPDGNITVDASGNPEIQVYPSLFAPGNFGQLSLDDTHVGEPTEANWVQNGISSSDLSALVSANLIPLSSHDSTKWNWIGDTGMKQSLVSTIDSYAGTTFYMPLFKPYSTSPYSPGVAQGSQYCYQIVQFVGVKLMPGSNGAVIVEPTGVIDPNALYSSITPAGTGTQGTSVTTFTAPKLTQ